MGITVTFTPSAIREYTGMGPAELPLPAAERKFRLANIAGMAIALGANVQNATRVAAQVVDMFGGMDFFVPLVGKERRELPADVNLEIEQLGRLLLVGTSQQYAYPVGCWAVALAREDVAGSHYQFVHTWVGKMADSNAAVDTFKKYVRENG